jgi:hypothetical protein
VIRSGNTKEALWQNGQRKLQPLVNTVQATCPGKSSNVIFIKPEIFIFAPVSSRFVKKTSESID